MIRDGSREGGQVYKELCVERIELKKYFGSRRIEAPTTHCFKKRRPNFLLKSFICYPVALTKAGSANINTFVASQKIAIITGSTRSVRIGPSVTEFVSSVLRANLSPSSNIELSIVDIATFKLTAFDEAVVPAAVPYAARKIFLEICTGFCPHKY